jgi:cobalt-zinc-cadmium efflux system outer membrane protein
VAIASTTPDALIAMAEEQRPDLAAAAAQAQAAESSLALARRQRIPDVALTGNYQQQGRGQDALQPPTATFGVQLLLPVLDRNQGAIAKSESQLRAQRLLREKVEAQVTADVRTAWSAFVTAQARAERSQTALLERARRARELVDYQYQKGAVSLFERLDAERQYVTAVVESYQTLADFWTALYQLEAAVGTELDS